MVTGSKATGDLARLWPVVAGLIVQALIFAYFVGGLSTKVDGLTVQVEKLATKEGVSSVIGKVDAVSDRMTNIEGKIERIDRRVTKVEVEIGK